MSERVEHPAGRGGGADRPPAPREHGAWGILLIPFATAAGTATAWNLPLALLLVSVLGFYLARTSWLRGQPAWTVRLLALAVLAGLPLLLVWHLWWLPLFGVAAAPLAFRKTTHAVAGQLLAVAGLTLTAPAAWYAATTRLDRTALLLWIANTLYFCGGVLHVKMHLAAAMNRGAAAARRGNLLFHALLPPAIAGLAMATGHGAWPAVAFVPATARAVVGVVRLTPVLRIKRLGWTEVAWSLVYGVALVLLLRGPAGS